MIVSLIVFLLFSFVRSKGALISASGIWLEKQVENQENETFVDGQGIWTPARKRINQNLGPECSVAGKQKMYLG